MASLSPECFHDAEELERLSERIYRQLTQRFSEAKTASAMFLRLAGEEIQHADRVRLLSERYRNGPDAFCDVADFPRQLEELIQEGSILLAMVEDLASSFSLKEALRLAIEMERKFCVAHSEVVISDDFPEIKAFFQHLARGDKEHRALLQSIPVTA